MKKILFLTITPVIWISASYQQRTPEFCQSQFDANITDVLRTLSKSVPPQEIKLAQAYIRLVKTREILDAQIIVLERSTVIDPRVQGPLKKPFDNFSDCIKVNLLFPRETKIAQCENKYVIDVQEAIANYARDLSQRLDISEVQKATLLESAKKYIQLYRERGETNNKLLLFEQQTILNIKPLEGRLRKPYDIYDQCKDPASLIPLNFRT